MRCKRATLFGSAAVAAAGALLIGSALAAAAAPYAQAGPYHVEITTDPQVIPVGSARLFIRVTTASGEPAGGAQVSVIAQMPGMPMGEQQQAAVLQPGQPGIYIAQARFAMAGAYVVTVHLSGPAGDEAAHIPLKTGEDTGGLTSGNPSAPAGHAGWLLPCLLGGLAAAFVVYRMRKSGQRVPLRVLLRPQVLAGIALLVAVYFVSAWVVRRCTKPGHMSVIEAQAMDMTEMRPPVGAAPVAAMAAVLEPISSTVRYTGSAVGYQDVDVTARVAGELLWMPLYPGDRVRRGDLLARLDTSELGSRVREQAAGVTMAEHQVMIARQQYAQARSTAAQVGAQVAESMAGVAGARDEAAASVQDVAAARAQRDTARADLQSAQTAVQDAGAQVSAATADVRYWAAELRRSEALAASGAISTQELQQDQDAAEGATTRLRQAEARVRQANAGVTSAESRLSASGAMISAAQARAGSARAKLSAALSRAQQARDYARAMEQAAAVAAHEIPHAQAGVGMARAQLETARVVAGYTAIRAEANGVVTQRIVSPGTLVQPGQAILRISQEQPIRLQVNVAEDDVPRIEVGAPVRVWGPAGSTHAVSAHVTSLFPSADPIARTSIVEAVYPNEGRQFAPGDFITMTITTGHRSSALVVPASAVAWQPAATGAVMATGQQPAVWVIQAGAPEKTIYTCTMHPEIKQDKPGKCPI